MHIYGVKCYDPPKKAHLARISTQFNGDADLISTKKSWKMKTEYNANWKKQ